MSDSTHPPSPEAMAAATTRSICDALNAHLGAHRRELGDPNFWEGAAMSVQSHVLTALDAHTRELREERDELLEWCIVDLRRYIKAFDDGETDLSRRCIARAKELGVPDALDVPESLASKWGQASLEIEAYRQDNERLSAEIVDLMERLTAAESEEVCGAAHPDPFKACPWCERDELRAQLSAAQKRLDTLSEIAEDRREMISAARDEATKAKLAEQALAEAVKEAHTWDDPAHVRACSVCAALREREEAT